MQLQNEGLEYPGKSATCQATGWGLSSKEVGSGTEDSDWERGQDKTYLWRGRVVGDWDH